MGAKVNYTLVGVFVVVLGSAIIATIVWLSTRGTHKSYDLYLVYVYESVAGLNPGAPVKYRGVDVGLVRSIDLDKDNPERVKVLLDIEEGTPIKTDTEAVLSRQGLTGIAYVDLAGGTAAAPPLTAARGERYPVIPAGQSLLLRIDTAVSATQTELFEVTREVKSVLRNLNGFLVEENRQAMSDTLRNVAALSASLAEQSTLLRRNLERLQPVLEHLDKATAQLPELIGQANRQLPAVSETTRSSLESVRSAAKSITRAARHFDALVVDARAELSQLSHGPLAQTGALVGELEQLSASLRRMARNLEKDPNQLLIGRPRRSPGPGE